MVVSGRWLRWAGRPPLMAQAPTAIRILQWARNSRRTWTFSALHRPPSIRPMSQSGLMVLMSVSGERSNSMCSSSVNSRSSMSRKDMWQPKQPASEVVATFSFLVGAVMSAALHRFGNRRLVVLALADRHREALAFLEDHADRADLRRLVIDREVGVAELAGLGIDDQVRLDAAPGQREDVLAIDVAAGPHAQRTEDAAVEVEQHLGMRGIDRPVREEVVVVRAHHAEVVGGGLQLAVAALLARRAEVVAFNEQHLGQRPALGVDFLGGALDDHAGGGAHRTRGGMPAIDLDRAQLARAVRLEFRVVAQVRDADAGGAGRLDDGLAVFEGDGLAVEGEGLVHALPPFSVARCATASSRPVICRAAPSARSRSKAGVKSCCIIRLS